MKSIKTALFFIVLLALSTGNASAAVLWDQMALEGTSLISSTYYNQRGVDDFSLSGAYRITNLVWNGSETLPDGFNIDVYESIYDASLGRYRAGDIFYSRSVSMGEISVGAPLGGYREYFLDISADPFEPSAGASYWLSIQAQSEPGIELWWGWHLASTENLNAAQQYGSFQPINEPPFPPGVYYDLAFRLEGVEVSAVPVPAAVWLLASGLAGLYFRRRQE